MNIRRTRYINKDALVKQALLKVYRQKYPDSTVLLETATKEDIRRILLDYISDKPSYRKELIDTAHRAHARPETTLISKINQSFLGGYDYFPEYEAFYSFVKQKIPSAGFTADMPKERVTKWVLERAKE